jgi:hypothetical protein
MFRRKTLAAVGVALVSLMIGPLVVREAFAIPTLSLDILGGVYNSDPDIESIQPTTDPFTLVALLNPDMNDPAPATDPTARLTYMLSIAVQPPTTAPATLGSFTLTFNGVATTFDVTQDLVFGTPPIEANLQFQAQDLPKHGVFPTYFMERQFTFDPLLTTLAYNSEDNPGGLSGNPAGTMFFRTFDFDTTTLAPGTFLHFDLYRSVGTTNLTIAEFAPFSRDADSRRVPEPGSLLFLGLGFAGLVAWRRMKPGSA